MANKQDWVVARRGTDSHTYYIKSIWGHVAQWTPDVDDAMSWSTEDGAEQFWLLAVASNFPTSFVMKIEELEWFVEKRVGVSSYFLQDITTGGKRTWTSTVGNAKGFVSPADTQIFIKSNLPNDNDLHIYHNEPTQ